uniref:Uncharacterized protein n=1 Tax=Ascaris lumbricoides TaxID=6252 RepID=A0A0M3HZU3_ASCLU
MATETAEIKEKTSEQFIKLAKGRWREGWLGTPRKSTSAAPIELNCCMTARLGILGRLVKKIAPSYWCEYT